MIPKNKKVSNVFFIKSDEIFSSKTPKKYATGIKLKNQGPSPDFKTNTSYAILKKSQKVMYRKPEYSSGKANFLDLLGNLKMQIKTEMMSRANQTLSSIERAWTLNISH